MQYRGRIFFCSYNTHGVVSSINLIINAQQRIMFALFFSLSVFLFFFLFILLKKKVWVPRAFIKTLNFNRKSNKQILLIDSKWLWIVYSMQWLYYKPTNMRIIFKIFKYSVSHWIRMGEEKKKIFFLVNMADEHKDEENECRKKKFLFSIKSHKIKIFSNFMIVFEQYMTKLIT